MRRNNGTQPRNCFVSAGNSLRAHVYRRGNCGDGEIMDIDWKNPFRADDFKILTPGEEHRIRDPGIAADFANQKFRKIIEACPVVYGNPQGDIWSMCPGPSKWEDTHSARLIAIERIENEI